MGQDPVTPAREVRYAEVSRRAFLKQASSLGAFVFLASCSTDAATLISATSSTAGEAGAVAAPAAGATASNATAAPTTTTAAAGGALPPDGELVVRFTYRADSVDGRARNPYIAVWVEDDDGELVDTLALWFLQSRKGSRWLPDLIRWSSVDGSETTVNAVSGATRRPGDYSLAWDGTDINGSPATQGEYFICIESAREHGPHSLIREPLTLSGRAFTTALPAHGELTNASVELVA